MLATVPYTMRRARKRHRCQTQAHFDGVMERAGAEAAAQYGRPCPEGGWIEPGTVYAESTDGWDIYHPYRYHVGCTDHTRPDRRP